MEENANELHFKCADFNSYARVTAVSYTHLTLPTNREV